MVHKSSSLHICHACACLISIWTRIWIDFVFVIKESFLNRNQTSNTSTTTTPSAKQNAAMSTNGSNEVKNHSAGAYENVGYFKIEEVSTIFRLIMEQGNVLIWCFFFCLFWIQKRKVWIQWRRLKHRDKLQEQRIALI